MKDFTANRLLPAAAAAGVFLGSVTGCGNAAEYPAYEGALQPLDLPERGTLLSADLSGVEPDIEFDAALPRDYRSVFYNSLQHPIVRLASETGVVQQATAMIAETDEASYQPQEKEMIFEVSELGPDEPGMYYHSKSIAAIAVHEAVHGITYNWYQVYENNQLSGDETLDNRLADVRAACAELGELIQRDFVTDSRERLIDAYGDLAELYMSTGQDRFAGQFTDAAEGLERNDVILYPESDGSTCSAPYSEHLPYLSAGKAAEQLNGYEEVMANSPELMSLKENLERNVEEAYRCVDDGFAIDDLLNIPRKSGAGHPQDNVTETASSLASILAVNPTYLPECFDSLPSGNYKEKLLDLVQAVLRVMAQENPDLMQIVMQDSDAASVVRQFS